MASPDSRSATAQDPSATSEGDRTGSGGFESEEFRRKLELARERRATALGRQPPPKPAPPRPDTSVLVLRSAEPQAGTTPAAQPSPASPPLAAPPRATSRVRAGGASPVRGRGASLVVWTTMGMAAGCVLAVVVSGISASPPRTLPERPFAIETTAPAPPSAPPDLAPAAPPDWPGQDSDPAIRTAAPAEPGPEPEVPNPPEIGGPPPPALSAFAATPVRLLGAEDGRIAEVSEDVRAAGIETVATRSVGLAPATSVVRFFRAEDRPLAEGLALRLDADLQNLTSYAPAPTEPGVEVWLSGS